MPSSAQTREPEPALAICRVEPAHPPTSLTLSIQRYSSWRFAKSVEQICARSARDGSSTGLRILAAQFTTQHFSRWVARQGVDEIDRLWTLVRCNFSAGILDEVGL